MKNNKQRKIKKKKKRQKEKNNKNKIPELLHVAHRYNGGVLYCSLKIRSD